MESNNSRLMAVDGETGEVLDGAKIYTKEQLEANKRHKEIQKKAEQYRADKPENQFVWNLFNGYKNLSDLKPQTAIRLTYLATYLEYDSDFLKNNGDLITREKMQSLMVLNDTAFKKFIKEVTDKGYLIKEKKCYRINKEVFNKGKLKPSKDLAENRAMRIYINAIRKLYLATPSVKHVYLGYVFQLIPYVNREYNIVCHNPLETNRENIDPITVGQFCDLIGYDKSNASRLINVYRDITFEWQGKEMTFCGYYWEPKKADMRFFVNPLIFFAGSDYHRVEILELCFI